MKKVSLLFGVHMHQPVDNFGASVDEAIELCYAPFFETMLQYPDFKFSVHCSGWLLDQIKTKRADIFKNMQILTKKGSIEWFSAGYYEPVLSSIPSRDRQAQIKKLNTYITKNLKTTPKGLWLTERVWESAIVPDIAQSGIDFALVDDYHFLSSGFSGDLLDGYYETEEGGHSLSLFPINASLRYALPFFSVQKALSAITDCAIRDDSAAIIFDDAEKFGLWPQTHQWVYEQKWLEQFVQAVLDNEQIETKHFGEYKEQNRSRGVAYLGNTSYFEMGEWSLRSAQTLALEALKERVGKEYFDTLGVAFIKGGIWKNYFIKYHESNYLHKRMLSHSKNQEHLSKKGLDNLYKMQTNDVFWHGVFGGLYLPNLRDNAYAYLLGIEKEFAKKQLSYSVQDIDMDGYDELKVLSRTLSIVFSSRFGGQMVECGSLARLFNWQNTLMRREEAYHEQIRHPKEQVCESSDDAIATIHSSALEVDANLKDELIYDWHPKNSFVDHFAQSPFSLENFSTLTYKEVGDFANQPFELDEESKTFSRNGGIYLDTPYPTKLEKQYSFEHNSVEAHLVCSSEYAGKLEYAMEFNLHLAHPHLALFNGEKIEAGLGFGDINSLVIFDTFTQKKLILTCSEACHIYAHTIHTISQSESGFERVAQQVSLIFCFSFKSSFETTMRLEVRDV